MMQFFHKVQEFCRQPRFYFMLLVMLTFPAIAQQIPVAIVDLLNKHHLAQEDVSVVVQNVRNTVPLVNLNDTTLRAPASTAKLLTTAAGLIRMGVDYRWQTEFYLDKLPDANGVSQGNLYIKGGGDPFLVEEQLTQMLQALRDQGLRHITGNIVLDMSLYQLPPEERDAAAFDGHPLSAYNAIPNPLMVNFRTIKVQIVPQGDRAVRLLLSPNIANWTIENQLTISNKSCQKNYAPNVALIREENGFARLQVSGAYSTACGACELTLALGEASEQFYYLFYQIWHQLGGSFDGSGVIATVPKTAKIYYTGLSLPLAEQIQKMNQLSNNVMTRQLMLTLGAFAYGQPANLESGRRAVLETLRQFGVPLEHAIIDNGSGLSRQTRVSAGDLATLLFKMYHSEYADTFISSLAVAGHSGTLKKRFRGEKLAGRIYGKTGTIDEVRSFAGYLLAENGNTYIVVIITNGKTAAAGRPFQDDVFRWVDTQ